MTRRKLTPEERKLWDRVTSATERLHPKLPDSLTPENPARINPEAPVPARRIDLFEIGGKVRADPVRLDIAPDLARHLSDGHVRVDQKVFRKLKRGKLSPEARMDLHGMTVADAHPALNRFIVSAASSGKRLVLVITGKGRESRDWDVAPERRGVLRRQVPGWLSSPPLSTHVMQVVPAHASHGGDGAFYVYLRRWR